MKQQKVLIALPVLLLGGTELQTLNLVRFLVNAGYSVTVCCYYEYTIDVVNSFRETGAQVTLLGQRRAVGLWQLLKVLVTYLRLEKPDILHVQYMAPGFIPVLAAHIAGVRTVFATVHQPGRPYGHKAKLLLRTAAAFCTAFFCVSKSAEQSWFGSSELFESARVPGRKRHFTIYNAVDTVRISEIVKSVDRKELRDSIGLGAKPAVGIVARLRSEKGHAMLLYAMAEVIEQIPEAMLVVVGDGPDQGKLKEQASALGIQPHIVWLGQKTTEEVFQLYSVMDVVAVPSLFEGFGLSAAEAMAAGLPVVGMRVDGLTEVIEDGITGILVQPGDGAGLSTALIHLLLNRETARSMGTAGKERAIQRFSLGRFSECINSAYEAFAG